MKRLSRSVDTLLALGDPVLVVVGEEEEKKRKKGKKVRMVGAVFMQRCDAAMGCLRPSSVDDWGIEVAVVPRMIMHWYTFGSVP